MIIFPEQKKIILHIPKTGGTFLKSIISDIKNKEYEIVKGSTKSSGNIIDNSHLTFQEAKSIQFLKYENMSYKTYSFVRNVEDRLNSSIHECLRQNLLNQNTVGYYNDNEIKKSLEILIDKLEYQFKNNWINYGYELTHFKPQFLYVKDTNNILNFKILKNLEILSKFLKKEFDINISYLNTNKKNLYKSAFPYSNNKMINIIFRKFLKKNYLSFRVLNYKLKKKISFSTNFKKEFEKILILYKDDKKIFDKLT